jgi:hypothetical protein
VHSGTLGYVILCFHFSQLLYFITSFGGVKLNQLHLETGFIGITIDPGEFVCILGSLAVILIETYWIKDGTAYGAFAIHHQHCS